MTVGHVIVGVLRRQVVSGDTVQLKILDWWMACLTLLLRIKTFKFSKSAAPARCTTRASRASHCTLRTGSEGATGDAMELTSLFSGVVRSLVSEESVRSSECLPTRWTSSALLTTRSLLHHRSSRSHEPSWPHALCQCRSLC